MMRPLICGIAALGLFALIGCSGSESTFDAKGVLTWDDGKPIPGVSLRLVPKESGKQELIAISGKDGEFSLATMRGTQGGQKGEYTVVVTSMPTGGGEVPTAAGPMTPEEMMKAAKTFKEKQKKMTKSEIPAIYSDAAKSPLLLKIDGPNLKIELKLKRT